LEEKSAVFYAFLKGLSAPWASLIWWPKPTVDARLIVRDDKIGQARGPASGKLDVVLLPNKKPPRAQRVAADSSGDGLSLATRDWLKGYM
jgi:hypothetical protein